MSQCCCHAENSDGNQTLFPYNLITSWFWVYGEPARPVRTYDLEAVYFEGEDYHPEVVAKFDSNGNGTIEENELAIDTPEKESFIAGRLTALGLKIPELWAKYNPTASATTSQLVSGPRKSATPATGTNRAYPNRFSLPAIRLAE